MSKSVRIIEKKRLYNEEGKIKCIGCGVDKSLDNFYKSKGSLFGLRQSCRDCCRNKYKKHKNVTYTYQKKEYKVKNETLLQIGRKICSRCRIEKPLDKFGKTNYIKCGYSSWCSECDNNEEKRKKKRSHRISKNPEYYDFMDKRKVLLQQGKCICYTCKEISLIENFKGVTYCKKCNREHNRINQRKKILSKDPDYYIKKEKERKEILSKDPDYYIKKEKEKRDKENDLTQKDLLLAEGKKECRKCKKVLPIVSFETIEKYNCISCYRGQKKINKIKYREKKKIIRMKNDPEYRKRVNKIKTESDIKRRLTDDEWRIRKNKIKNERFKERMKDPEYRKKHNERKEKWDKERRDIDPIFAMKKRVSCRIRNYMSREGYEKKLRTHEILGIDWPGFKEHMERQFVNGMSWENRDQWHIDHIIPLATAICEDDVIRLNHYTNLQPLWAEDNIIKGSKIL